MRIFRTFWRRRPDRLFSDVCGSERNGRSIQMGHWRLTAQCSTIFSHNTPQKKQSPKRPQKSTRGSNKKGRQKKSSRRRYEKRSSDLVKFMKSIAWNESSSRGWRNLFDTVFETIGEAKSTLRFWNSHILFFVWRESVNLQEWLNQSIKVSWIKE